MNIAICEDEVVQINLLSDHIKNWAHKNNINIYIDTFKTAESFLIQWSDYEKYDIIFLDIKLSEMSGIDLSNIIREKNKIVDIVFVTGFFKYVLHGYKVGALQYLIKPINKFELYFCLDKTLERISDKNNTSMLIINTTKQIIKLDYNEIYYCIMFSPYIEIHTNLEKIVLRKKISEMEGILPSEYFVRCHRSYIVNIKKIKSITKNNVVLENEIKIPISRGKYNEINNAFIDYISERGFKNIYG